MDIKERLRVFYDRLRRTPPARNAEEAFRLICQTPEEVEEELCAVPKQIPPPKSFNGRMYLPQPDNVTVAEDKSLWVKTRHHRIMIKSNGPFVIFREMPHNTFLTEFQKEGVTQ